MGQKITSGLSLLPVFPNSARFTVQSKHQCCATFSTPNVKPNATHQRDVSASRNPPPDPPQLKLACNACVSLQQQHEGRHEKQPKNIINRTHEKDEPVKKTPSNKCDTTANMMCSRQQPTYEKKIGMVPSMLPQRRLDAEW